VEERSDPPKSYRTQCGRRKQPVRRSRSFRNKNGAFALFHEPAREHGGSVFLQPLIEEGADLLAEIGGVAKAESS
jgi:hypothetical protein